MKILILGHKEHGKTTIAEIFRNEYGLLFNDTSMEAAKILIFHKLKHKFNYNTYEECYNDRRNRRKEWYDLINKYNIKDKTRLTKIILEYNDLYVGMREQHQINKCIEEKLFDYIIGIYNPQKPLESEESFNIDIFRECDIIFSNTSTKEALKIKVKKIFDPIIKKKI